MSRGADERRAPERTMLYPASAAPDAERGGPPPEPAGASALWRPGDDDLHDGPPRARPHNPLVEAAAPRLALAASVRSGRIDLDLPQLHRKAAAAAQAFDHALAASGYDEEVRRRARYAVFATVDDIAQNLPGRAVDGAEWARRSMVVRGFGESIRGDCFWQLLSQMLARPGEHVERIELYHACLAVGFEGRHRLGDQDAAALGIGTIAGRRCGVSPPIDRVPGAWPRMPNLWSGAPSFT